MKTNIHTPIYSVPLRAGKKMNYKSYDMRNTILRYGAFAFLFMCTIVLPAQTISLSAPALAGREAKLYYFSGAKADSLLSAVDNTGKVRFTLPAGDYRGMAALVVTNGGGIELVVAEPSVQVECNDNQLNTGTAVFRNSPENDFLRHIFTLQSKYMQQQAWLQAGGELFGADSPLIKQLSPERKKVEDSMAALDKEISSSGLYAARYYRLADFMNRLFDTEQKRDADRAVLIRKEMEESLDIASLYTSGQLWGSALNFYASLFNHTAGGDKQQQYAESVQRTSRRLSAPYYEAFLAGCITETERFGWRQAQDSILAGLHPQYIPENTSLQRALGAYRARSGQAMPLLAGLADTKESYEKTLVAFYDSDCATCVNEMFRLVSAYPGLQEQGIRVVSVSADKDRKRYEEGIKGFPWKDRLCDFNGFEGENFSNYNVIGTPSFFLTGKDGKLEGMFYAVEELMKIKN